MTDTAGPVEQRSSEWFASRIGVITGSRAAALIGTPAAYRKYLVEKACEIATGQVKTVDAAPLKFGRDNEPKARSTYEFVTGNPVTLVGLEKFFLNSRMCCSPDGLVDNGGIIEIKCRMQPNEHVEALFDNTPPKKELPQIQWNLMVTSRQWCDYVSYCPAMPPNSQTVVIRVRRDEDMIAKLKGTADKFLNDLDDMVTKLIEGQP